MFLHHDDLGRPFFFSFAKDNRVLCILCHQSSASKIGELNNDRSFLSHLTNSTAFDISVLPLMDDNFTLKEKIEQNVIQVAFYKHDSRQHHY